MNNEEYSASSAQGTIVVCNIIYHIMIYDLKVLKQDKE